MTGREEGGRHWDAPPKKKKKKQTKHTGGPSLPFSVRHTFFPYTSHTAHTHPHTHPPFGPACWLQPSQTGHKWLSNGPEEERGSHATGAGTGAPPGGIYSRPALKGWVRGHACFPFHSLGTFTRPHMWVLNIYPNTGSNTVGAENRRQWALLERREGRERWRVERAKRVCSRKKKKERQQIDR